MFILKKIPAPINQHIALFVLSLSFIFLSLSLTHVYTHIFIHYHYCEIIYCVTIWIFQVSQSFAFKYFSTDLWQQNNDQIQKILYCYNAITHNTVLIQIFLHPCHLLSLIAVFVSSPLIYDSSSVFQDIDIFEAIR